MEFTQQREYPNNGLSYEMQYSLEESDSHISGIIVIEAGTGWGEVEVASIEPSEELELSFETVESGTQKIRVQFDLTYPNRTTGGKMLTTICDGENTEKLHIQLSPAELLVLYRRLLEPEVPVQAYDQLDSILNDYDGKFSLADVINCSPYAVTRLDLITILDRIGEYDSSMKDPVRGFFISELTDWIHHQGTGKYFDVSSPDELESLAKKFSEKENTRKLDRPVLSTIIEQREDYIGRGLKGFLEHNLDHPAFPYYDLSVKSRAFMFAQLTIRADPETLINKISQHANKEDFDIDEQLEDYDSTSLKNLVEEIPVAARDNPISAKYAIAHYLRLFLFADKTEAVDPQTEAYLWRAIIRLTENQPFSWLAEDARHKRHLALAKDCRETDPERAANHFDQAILVLSQSSEWDYSKNDYVYTIYEKTKHKIERLREDRLFDKSIEELSEFTELIREFGEERTGFQERVLHELQGLQYEIRAEKLVSEDQLERARELYNKAAGEYRQSDNRPFFYGVKGRQYQIDALLAELSGEFEKAADAHQNYVDELPESDGATFHKVRRYISLAKAQAVNGEYDAAIERLDKLSTDLQVDLQPAERQFRHLLQAANAFENEEETANLDEHIQALILGLEENEESFLLNFSDDFSTGLLTVLAAHRLRDLPVNESRLRDLIQLSIESACYPKASQDRTQSIRRVSVSPAVATSHEWELSLPSHVINQLDQVRIEEQTTFGEADSLVWRLGVVVEQTLSILREYYARQYWGEGWESEVPGEGKPSIGDLYQFFKTDAAEDLNSAEEIVNVFDSEILEDRLLIKGLRDALAHGRNPSPETSREKRVDKTQFSEIFELIIDMMKIATTDIPVIGYVDSKFAEDTYKITLQWGGLPKQIWITSSYELETKELYYFPRSAFDDTTARAVSISEDVIEPCEGERAVTHLPN